MEGLGEDASGILSALYITATSFVVGLTSKAVLDMPIGKSKSDDETHFKVKDIVAFIFPEVRKSFQNIIRSKERTYFDHTSQGIRLDDVKEIARVAYDWLKDKIDWQSEEKQRELDVLMNGLRLITDRYEALRYLYRNLGREEFEYAFGLRK
jgi:hypothetical protein